MPSAVFTDPQIAAVGRTEAQCRDEGLDVAVSVQNYGDVAYGWAMEDTTGFCKVLAERGSGRLLGAHIIGPSAATVIHHDPAMSFAWMPARGLRAVLDPPGATRSIENAYSGWTYRTLATISGSCLPVDWQTR